MRLNAQVSQVTELRIIEAVSGLDWMDYPSDSQLGPLVLFDSRFVGTDIIQYGHQTSELYDIIKLHKGTLHLCQVHDKMCTYGWCDEICSWCVDPENSSNFIEPAQEYIVQMLKLENKNKRCN